MEGDAPLSPSSENAEKTAEKSWSPVVLSADMGDLAVAYGAAYYGQVRKGKGIRISGGIGRSYYIGVGMERQKTGASTGRRDCIPAGG